MEPISLKEAVDTVFNYFDTSLPKATVQTWMRHKVFVPVEQASRRDPRGCRLDISDLTTLLILRALSACGVGIASLHPKKFDFYIPQDRIPKWHRLLSVTGEGRAIQAYIEAHNYKVHAVVWTSLLWAGHEIQFRPSESVDTKFLEYLRDNNSGHPAILLNVSPLYEEIKNTLKGE